MIINHTAADLLMAAGSLIGLAVKGIALADGSTVWSRKSSGLNVATYPFTALLPMFVLELWATAFVASINYWIWVGIYVWRAPDEENWFGRR